MSDAASFTVKMVDQVSGPAKNATKAMNGVNAAMKRTKAAAGGASAAVDRAGGAAGAAGSNMQKAVAGGTMLGTIMGNIATAALQAGAALVRLGLQGAVAFGKAVVEAAAFRENIEFSLTRFLGDANKAKSAVNDVMKISNKYALDFQTAADNFKDFVSAGFSEQASKDLLVLKADLRSMSTGSAEGLAKIESAFGHIQKGMAMGRMEADGFNEVLGNLPITKTQLMDKLAVKLGKSTEEMMKMDVTKMPVDKLIEAIKEATLEATGASELGETALKKQMSTFSGMWQATQIRAKNSIDQIAANIGPALGEKLMPLLEQFNTWLTSPEGEAAMKGVGDAILGIIDATMAFGSGVAEVMGPVIDIAKQLADAFGESDGSMQALKTTAKVVGAILAIAFTAVLVSTAGVVAAVVAIIAAVDWLIDAGQSAGAAVAEAFNGIGSAASGLLDSVTAVADEIIGWASGLGASIIDGIVGAITGGASSVASALTSAAQGAIDAAKGVLGIHSPSAVFAGIGHNVVAGMEQGIEGGQPGIKSAMAATVSPPSGGGTTNSISTPMSVSMSVNAADDPAATAAAIRSMLENELAGAFEQVALTIGVAGAPA